MGMSMLAVTAYLREIRSQKDISQKALADAMGLSLRQTNRWETEGTEGIKADALMRAVSFLGASIQHVMTLFAREDATAEDGQRLALEWLTEEQNERINRMVDTPAKAEAVLQAIQE